MSHADPSLGATATLADSGAAVLLTHHSLASAAAPLRLPARWLASLSPANFAPNSQRLAMSLPPATLRVTSARASPIGLEVEFDGSPATSIPWRALAASVSSPLAHPRAAWAARAEPWPALASPPPFMAFEELCTPRGGARARAQLAARGLVLVRGVPGVAAAGGSEQGVLAVARAIGIPMETNYGVHFDVRAVASPTNGAFAEGPLPLHTDNPYRALPPGFQALACVHAAGEGGATMFADGAALARTLSPADAQALATVPVAFEWRGGGARLAAAHPVLELRPPHLLSVAWNERALRAPPPQEADAWFNAAGAWARALEGGSHACAVRLAPGEAVVWDNRRLLHGRQPYQDGGGEARWLQGAYISEDSVLGVAAEEAAEGLA